MTTTGQMQTVSRPTLLRLPSYHRLLKHMQVEGRQTVSCTPIAEILRLDATQVRKDIAATGIIGRPRIGYDVGELVDAIETFLGWNNASDALLAGAGSLGTAILGYQGFREYGLNIVAAFDVDPDRIGDEIHGKPVLHMDKLPDLASRIHAKIGIITVPESAAESVANLMVLSDIRAIWNFTPVHLDVPASVIVENVRLSESLSVLKNRLIQDLKTVQ